MNATCVDWGQCHQKAATAARYRAGCWQTLACWHHCEAAAGHAPQYHSPAVTGMAIACCLAAGLRLRLLIAAIPVSVMNNSSCVQTAFHHFQMHDCSGKQHQVSVNIVHTKLQEQRTSSGTRLETAAWLAEACRNCSPWASRLALLSNMSLDRVASREDGCGAVSASSRSRCFRRLKGNMPGERKPGWWNSCPGTAAAWRENMLH